MFFLPAACSYVFASVIWKVSIFNGTPLWSSQSSLAIFHVAPIEWVLHLSLHWYWLVLVTVVSGYNSVYI